METNHKTHQQTLTLRVGSAMPKVRYSDIGYSYTRIPYSRNGVCLLSQFWHPSKILIKLS
jgi:hypothetical protein